ncbi:unnamed protein product, partial [Rotaria magnacalcarata]
MLVRNNIKPIYSSPNHLESNGGVERANQTLQHLLARYEGEHTDWVRSLPEVVRIYNSSPHATTKRTPVSFFLQCANSLRKDQDNLLKAAWREPSPKLAPFMVSQLVGKKIIHKGFLTKNKLAPKFEGPFQIISVNPNERSYQISAMINELTPMYSQLIKVHHSNLRPWVPRPNYLARFDLGGEVFPPPVRLNKPVSSNHARMPFGNSNHNSSVPNNRIFNNFIGFQAANPPVPPIAPGGNTITSPVINELGSW